MEADGRLVQDKVRWCLLTQVEMERGGRMDYGVEAGDLDDFVEGSGLGNVGHNLDIQLILRLVCVGLSNALCFFLGPHRGHHTMPLL
mgnify:CR=1 FL=1